MPFTMPAFIRPTTCSVCRLQEHLNAWAEPSVCVIKLFQEHMSHDITSHDTFGLFVILRFLHSAHGGDSRGEQGGAIAPVPMMNE